MGFEPHPEDAGDAKGMWNTIELSFCIIYTVEALLKIFANGLLAAEYSYLRD